MAYTTINDPSAHFQSYDFSKSAGTGSTTFDGNSDLQPDFLWVKSISNNDGHEVWDSSRGVNSTLFTHATEAQDTSANRIVSFDTDGFTWGNAGNLNAGGTFVSWAWKANGGTTSSNTDGTITSTVQANTDAGFSIVTFTGNGSNDATIGHGLGVTPDMIITKNLADSVSWRVWHKDLTTNYMLFINATNAETSTTGQGNGYIKTVGSSTYSVYQGTIDTNGVNGSSDSMLAYCFASKQGFSKFGTYTGNNSTDGPFVYTGFKPAFVMIKSKSNSSNWLIIDDARDPANDGTPGSTGTSRLFPNLVNYYDNAESYDLLSNGFKPRSTNALANTTGVTYVYAAFARNPFVTSTGVPTTAR